MKRSTSLRYLAWFMAGVVVYVSVLVLCIASEPDTVLSQSCGYIGVLLKLPMYLVLPYAQSSYFGLDSALLFTLINAAFWGAVVALVSHVFTSPTSAKL